MAPEGVPDRPASAESVNALDEAPGREGVDQVHVRVVVPAIEEQPDNQRQALVGRRSGVVDLKHVCEEFGDFVVRQLAVLVWRVGDAVFVINCCCCSVHSHNLLCFSRFDGSRNTFPEMTFILKRIRSGGGSGYFIAVWLVSLPDGLEAFSGTHRYRMARFAFETGRLLASSAVINT